MKGVRVLHYSKDILDCVLTLVRLVPHGNSNDSDSLFTNYYDADGIQCECVSQ